LMLADVMSAAWLRFLTNTHSFFTN
jgi:hypothetical protein